MLLLEIQDLRLLRRALVEEEKEEQVESDHFNIEAEKAITALEEKIEKLEDELAPTIRKRYERGRQNLNRMVVPVIGGVCYGCFVSVPTARTGEENDEVQTCESCGRFIYFVS
jgi:predicted  nucleic acid-binding Zn-ribbon protein